MKLKQLGGAAVDAVDFGRDAPDRTIQEGSDQVWKVHLRLRLSQHRAACYHLHRVTRQYLGIGESEGHGALFYPDNGARINARARLHRIRATNHGAGLFGNGHLHLFIQRQEHQASVALHDLPDGFARGSIDGLHPPRHAGRHGFCIALLCGQGEDLAVQRRDAGFKGLDRLLDLITVQR
ncbi:hypothetical protein SDC9_93029 [bioreactor metagenome]|uniref:Uncharacterized protein n=1 Tax=bioreactor metagenome TaxID=1076179 RepID=A0A645A256_9ZZZZ